MVDPLAHLKVKKGCQDVDGKTALAYARSRHTSSLGDIDRAHRQREVVSTAAHDAVSLSTFLNPVQYYRLAFAAADSFTLGDDTSTFAAAKLAWALTKVDKSSGLTCGVPISDLDGPLGPQPRRPTLQVHPRGPHRRHPQVPLPTVRTPEAMTDPSNSYETLDYSVEDGILTLTLDRPDHLNAFTVTMANELVEAFGNARRRRRRGAQWSSPGGAAPSAPAWTSRSRATCSASTSRCGRRCRT